MIRVVRFLTAPVALLGAIYFYVLMGFRSGYYTAYQDFLQMQGMSIETIHQQIEKKLEQIKEAEKHDE